MAHFVGTTPVSTAAAVAIATVGAAYMDPQQQVDDRQSRRAIGMRMSTAMFESVFVSASEPLSDDDETPSVRAHGKL